MTKRFTQETLEKAMEAIEKAIAAARNDFEVDAPGIYQWRVKECCYIGKCTNPKRRFNQYRRNVERLLAGLRYHIKDSKYRRIHRALAIAARKGWDVELRMLLENVDREQLTKTERDLIDTRKPSLNGLRRGSYRACGSIGSHAAVTPSVSNTARGHAEASP